MAQLKQRTTEIRLLTTVDIDDIRRWTLLNNTMCDQGHEPQTVQVNVHQIHLELLVLDGVFIKVKLV